MRVWVEGDQAVAMYRIVTTQTDRVGLGGAVWAATRFRVDNGRISQIESIYRWKGAVHDERIDAPA